MTTSDTSKQINGEIGIGCIGWFILNNLASVIAFFVMHSFFFGGSLIITLWVLNLAIILTLLYTKRTWIGIGVFIGLIVNILIELTNSGGYTSILYLNIWRAITPFPLANWLIY